MGEMTSEGANAGAGIDLSQFYQVFFEEAGENLDRMEQLLLEVDIEAADDEELNSIFRCAHSVKGGAATFGFTDVAELTHQMETLLDKLRRHELAPTAAMVDVLLPSGDALRAQLARHQGSGGRRGRHHRTAVQHPRAGGRRGTAGRRCRSRGAGRRTAAAQRGGRRPPHRPPRPGPRSWSCASARWTSPSRPTTWSSCSRRSPTWAPSSRSTAASPATACAASRSSPPAATATCWTCSPSTSPARQVAPAAARPRLRLPRRRARRAAGRRRRGGRPGLRLLRRRAWRARQRRGDAGGAAAAPAASAAAAKPAARAGGQGREARGRRGRGLDAARLGREGRPAHQPGRRTRHHAGHAGAEQQAASTRRCTSSWPPAWPTWSATRATCRNR